MSAKPPRQEYGAACHTASVARKQRVRNALGSFKWCHLIFKHKRVTGSEDEEGS